MIDLIILSIFSIMQSNILYFHMNIHLISFENLFFDFKKYFQFNLFSPLLLLLL